MRRSFCSLSRSRPFQRCLGLACLISTGGRGNPTFFDNVSGRTPRHISSADRELSPARSQKMFTKRAWPPPKRAGSRQATLTLRTLITLTILFLLCLPASAQDKTEPSHPTEPTITFDVFWEAATPQNYTITVESSGKAKYVSRNPTRHEEGSEDASDPDYEVEFTLTPASRDQLFTLAKGNNYFQGDFEYKHKVANTGRKTLTYADPVRRFQTTYNFSVNKDIDQITRLFQGISNTIEHGRKLQFMRRFDKLSLDTELKGMEEMAQNGYLAEIQIIAPLLQNLANDTSILHLARQRAQHLLATVSPPLNQVQ